MSQPNGVRGSIDGRARCQRAILVLGCIAAFTTVSVFVRYRGLMLPLRIGSGSMAEQLLGPHYRVVCADCRFVFQCGLDVPVPLGVAVCPNCGYRRNTLSAGQLAQGQLAQGQLAQGQRVLIDRWAYQTEAPRRGDMVALVDPTNDREVAVKRVVGLPNERLRIAGGELYIDGQLHRKQLPAARQVAVLVHDDAFRHAATEELPSRWRARTEASGWQPVDAGFKYTPQQNTTASGTDWLAYHHWRCYGSPADRADEVPIADNDGYNQGLSRELNRVTDIWLSLRASLPPKTTLRLHVHDGREFLGVVLSMAADKAELLRDGTLVTEADLPNIAAGVPVELECGILDQQVFLTVNDQLVIWQRYEPSLAVDRTPRSDPLQIGVLSPGSVTVTNLKVFRDIYYLARAGSADTETKLAADEYFLIGDNVPLSRDSRHWPVPGVGRKRLLGKVFARK